MAWSVGYTGPVGITTRVEDEREIDIDDRGVNLVVTLEMLPTGPYALEARNLEVTLDFDFSPGDLDPAISFGGNRTGPFELIRKAENVTLRPGATVERVITVKTGAFSSTPITPETPSAVPGRKEIDARVSFELAPANPAGTALIERDATLQFVVAPD